MNWYISRHSSPETARATHTLDFHLCPRTLSATLPTAPAATRHTTHLTVSASRQRRPRILRHHRARYPPRCLCPRLRRFSRPAMTAMPLTRVTSRRAATATRATERALSSVAILKRITGTNGRSTTSKRARAASRRAAPATTLHTTTRSLTMRTSTSSWGTALLSATHPRCRRDPCAI